jgi:RNA polymerase-binding transcription factor DksA
MGGDDSASVREQLLAERERTATRLRQLDEVVDAIVESGDLDPPDDEHDPEGHTIGFERAFAQSLVDRARARLAALDRALERLVGGDYGRCAECGRSIATERLLAVPEATTCVDCAARGCRPSAG